MRWLDLLLCDLRVVRNKKTLRNSDFLIQRMASEFVRMKSRPEKGIQQYQTTFYFHELSAWKNSETDARSGGEVKMLTNYMHTVKLKF